MLKVQQRADHGDQHADGGQLHAAAGLVGRGQSLQAEDEQHRGDQVAGLDEKLASDAATGRRRGMRGHRRDAPVEQLNQTRHRLLPLLALEHLQHAVGDHESADHVDRRGRHRHEAQESC